MLELRFDEILAETDPVRQAALARKLRAEIREKLDPEDREKLRQAGFDVDKLCRRLRIAD